MKLLFLAFFLFCIFSCTKQDATPELSDEIYKDLQQELAVSASGLESEEKNLLKLEAEDLKVVPQTGQTKFSQKKIYETKNTIDKLRQQKQFFEIKLELRKHEVRQKYSDSLKYHTPWPDQNEIAAYKSTIKLQRDKLNWDKTKGVKKDVPRGTKETEAAPKAAPEH